MSKGMTLEQKLDYLSRCRCSPCREKDKTKVKSLEQLHLDSVFASAKEILGRYVLEKIKTQEEVSAKFVNAVELEALHLLHEAFDARCEYHFAKEENITG